MNNMYSMNSMNNSNNTSASMSVGPVTTYAATSETTIHHTVGIEVMTAKSLLSATERVAAYIYEDLRELAAKININLPEAMQAPPIYAHDPNLFQRLLSLDIEHLLRDQHVTDVALLLGDATLTADGQVPLRYRSSYHIERLVDWANSVDDPDTISLRSRVTRHGGRFDPLLHGRPDGQFALAVKWNPQTASTREIGMRYPRYHFRWTPIGTVVFDDEALLAAANTASATNTVPNISQPLAASPRATGVWTLNTLTHTVPHAYRPRPPRKRRLVSM
jgi:hypothetical protein